MKTATSKEKSKTVLLSSFNMLQTLLLSSFTAWDKYTAGWTAAEAASGKQLALQQLQDTGEQQSDQQLCLLRQLFVLQTSKHHLQVLVGKQCCPVVAAVL